MPISITPSYQIYDNEDNVTIWGRKKMAEIVQAIFSNLFPCTTISIEI